MSELILPKPNSTKASQYQQALQQPLSADTVNYHYYLTQYGIWGPGSGPPPNIPDAYCSDEVQQADETMLTICHE